MILWSAKWDPFLDTGQAVGRTETEDLRNQPSGFVNPSHLGRTGRQNEKGGKQIGLLAHRVSRPQGGVFKPAQAIVTKGNGSHELRRARVERAQALCAQHVLALRLM